jgi:hypothetical protein
VPHDRILFLCVRSVVTHLLDFKIKLLSVALQFKKVIFCCRTARKIGGSSCALVWPPIFSAFLESMSLINITVICLNIKDTVINKI